MAGMSTHDIQETIGKLRRGTELALRAGFSHIQLHAAHGYLFSLLIDDAFCAHTELVLDALASWAKDVDSASCESSLRFSVLTGDQGTDEGRGERLIDRLLALPFSFFDVTAGFYNLNKQLIYPSNNKLLSLRRDATVALAHRFVSKQIILSGKSNGAWDASLPENVHIGICRDLIANPNFIRDRAMGCTNCMKCHYYSLGARDLTCGRW
jgi:NADPH2 dehydrogenase